jgi:hypothetical protein
MAGERLVSARVSSCGIEGDRIVQVRNERGRMVTSRTHPALLGHHATLGPGGEPLIDRRPWSGPDVLADVRKIAGPEARLVIDDGLQPFDKLPLLVATDGAIAAFGRDGPRLRPNLVIGGVSGLGGAYLAGIHASYRGSADRVQGLRGRCIMTTLDPDTLAHDSEVQREIVKRFGGKLALNCQVVNEGMIRSGQKVELLRAK